MSIAVYSAVPYFSRGHHRGLDQDCDAAQDLIEAVKAGDMSAIKLGVKALARHPKLKGFKGIVTAAPRSSQSRPSNLIIAQELVSWGVGTTALQMVVRGTAVPSSRLRRRLGKEGVPFQQHLDSMVFVGQPTSEPVLVIDDMFTTGTTLSATAARIKKGGHQGTITGATVGYFVDDPRQVPDCPLKYTTLRA